MYYCADVVVYFAFATLFKGDEIRRLVTESLIPYLMEKGHVWKLQREYVKSKKDSDVQAFLPSQVPNSHIESNIIYNIMYLH